MDNGDKWRMFTCSSSSQDKTIINSLMLRFRPIAPKPVANGSSIDWNPASKNGLASCSVRTKRKYVRVKKRNEHYKRRTAKIKPVPSDLEKDIDQTTEMMEETEKEHMPFTLQLLPVDLVKDSPRDDYNNNNNQADPTVKISSDLKTATTAFHLVNEGGGGTDRRIRVIETVVTVESMTDTCMDDDCTDVERMNNLENDTCPGFISDGSGKVWRINEAYKKMIKINKGEGEEIRVKLEVKEKILPYLRNYSAFSCWVKLRYTWQKEKYSQSQMMIPCDVWKMRSFDGFAWSLDVKAALSLAI